MNQDPSQEVQPPGESESSNELSSTRVAAHLKQEFLGLKRQGVKEHWPEGDALAYRKLIKQTPPDKLAQKLREQPLSLDQKRQEILSIVFNQSTADAALNFNQVLQDDRDLYQALKGGIREFQVARLTEIGVDHEVIDQALLHVDQDQSYAEGCYQDQPADPLVILALELHDIAKFYQGKQVLLAEHEILSAALAGDVLRAALKDSPVAQVLKDKHHLNDQQLNDQIEAAAKFVEVAVAAHGLDEFPDKQAKQRGKLIDKQRHIYRFPDDRGGGLFYDNAPQLLANFIGSDVDDQTRDQLRSMVDRVRLADMAVGVDFNSFPKYHLGSNPDFFLSHNNSYQFIHSFADTFTGYQVDMPQGLGIENVKEFQDARLKGGLLFAVSKAACGPPEELEEFQRLCVDTLGDQGKALVNQAQQMAQVFQQGKQGRLSAQECLEQHYRLFKDSVEQHVAAVDVQKINQHPELNQHIDNLLMQMAVEYQRQDEDARIAAELLATLPEGVNGIVVLYGSELEGGGPQGPSDKDVVVIAPGLQDLPQPVEDSGHQHGHQIITIPQGWEYRGRSALPGAYNLYKPANSHLPVDAWYWDQTVLINCLNEDPKSPGKQTELAVKDHPPMKAGQIAKMIASGRVIGGDPQLIEAFKKQARQALGVGDQFPILAR
jgi:hypothetical protein